LTDEQVSALVASNVTRVDDLSFDGGVDVVVQGTSFLSTHTPAQIATLFDPSADVTVAFGADLDPILLLGTQAARDAAFDAVVSKLQASNVDTIEFTGAQISQLVSAGITINAPSSDPLEVVVNGTSFLSSSSSSLSTLFGDADVNVTVRLQDQDVNAVLAAGDLNTTATKLVAAGVDAVELDINHTLQLADAGLQFNTGNNLDVTVQGTHFLDVSSEPGVASLFSGPPAVGTVSQLFPGGHNTPPLPPFPSPPGAQAVTSLDQGLAPLAAGASSVSTELAQVLSQVDSLTDALATAGYAQLGSNLELLATLSEIGFGPDATVDTSLSDLMSVLARDGSAGMGLAGVLTASAAGSSSSLLEGLSGGLVSDGWELVPAGDAMPAMSVDPAALLAQLTQTGGGVTLLGGTEAVPADPFDPFNQHQKG
jgi:hypothetical protein